MLPNIEIVEWVKIIKATPPGLKEFTPTDQNFKKAQALILAQKKLKTTLSNFTPTI
jgi:hypothetical protein